MNSKLITMPKYEAYKDSGLRWLGEIPEHWSIHRFRYKFSFDKGLTITKENLHEEGVPCVNYGEVHSKFGFELDLSKHTLKCVNEEYIENNPKSLLSVGDFIYADTSEDIEGSGNFTQLISEGLVFSGYHTVVARPVIGNNNRYIAYVLDSIAYRNQIRNAVKGVKVFSITKTILKNTSVWFPPVSEQTAIANFLDQKTTQIDEAIAIKEKQIALLKERKQIIIQQAVTGEIVWNEQAKAWTEPAEVKDSGVDWIGEIPEHWETKKLKYLSTYFKGFAFKSDEFTDNGIPIVKASNIKEHSVSNIQSFIADNNQSREFEKFRLNSGDVIISTVGSKPVITNSAVGQVCSVGSEYDKSYLNQNTVCVRPNQKLDKNFLKYVFASKYIRNEFDRKALWIANQAYLEVDGILNILVSIPDLVEQSNIADYLDSQAVTFTEALEIQLQQIKNLKEYKTTLINSAVTGKIKVA